MRKRALIAFAVMGCSSAAWAVGLEDDPLLFKGMVDELEWRDAAGDPLAWDAQAWAGRDLHKLWLKSEGEYVDEQTEEAELQVLYSRAMAPYWDVQLGWRGDFQPTPERHWLALGVQGLAPYFFEVDAALFVGESGRTAARVEAEYELLFSQRLILTPEVELNLYGKEDARRGLGEGLSDLSLGLRLRYEIRREFAPYIGVNWRKLFGDTEALARAEGEDTDEAQLVAGLRAWF